MTENIFENKPRASAVFDALTARLSELGPYEVQVKRTSIHLARRSAFAGVHPRKTGILLVVRATAPIENPRIRKREQVSANRWHNELLLEDAKEIDAELMVWLVDAFRLSGA